MELHISYDTDFNYREMLVFLKKKKKEGPNNIQYTNTQCLFKFHREKWFRALFPTLAKPLLGKADCVSLWTFIVVGTDFAHTQRAKISQFPMQTGHGLSHPGKT